jgi:hypothetical protein
MNDPNTQSSQDPWTGQPQDGQELRGRVESAGPLMQVGERKSVYRDVVFKVDEDGPYKGKRYPWTAWFTDDKTSRRAYETLIGSGCDSLTGEDEENFAGIGSREQIAVMEREAPYTPEKPEGWKDGDPAPRTIYRVRVKWINNGIRGMGGEAVPEGRRAVIKSQLKNALAAAKSGRRDVSTGPDAQGNSVGTDGKLRDASGRVKF